VKVRPREAADQAAAEAFLARHDSLRVARLGELVHPLDHPAFAAEAAGRQGCARLWVITTNDNVDALRFYQRRGFCLAAVHRGAVDRSRASLKPEIPAVGAYGIPLRDEIELERPP
jgi:hypothetical protein